MNNKLLEMMVAIEVKKAMLKNRAYKGQGVIEYAGALVIAAAVVAGVLAVGPDGIKTLFSDIMTQVSTHFKSKLPT